VHIEIAGQKLAIRSDAGPEYVQELAEYVDGKLRDITAGQRSSYSLQRAALLVAMQIADELFREKDLNRRFRQRLELKLESLSESLSEHATRLDAL